MNTASSVNYSTVSGGSQNTASGEYSTVSGGGTNYASGFGSMVGGGRQNDAFGDYSTIGGGYTNYNAAQYATIPGGFYDTITTTGNFSYLFGVNSNLTQDSTFMVDMPHIWFGTEAAGYQFPVSRGSSSQVMVTDSVLYTNLRWGLARGGAGNILYGVNAYTHTNFGGYACTTGVNGQTQSYITICGGSGNLADSAGNTIVGGTSNRAIGRSSFIGGGWVNSTQGSFSIVVGGYLNNTDSTFAAVVGGNNNDALGQYSFIGNGNSNTAGRIYSMVGNGLANNASGYMSYIGTGYWNLAGGRYAAVTNGYADTAKGDCAAVLSGYDNLAGDSTLDTSAVVAGGWGNTARYRYSFIGGGKNNVTGGNYAAVAGGIFNTADSHYTFIGGGTTNTAAGYLSVIVGGYYNYTYGNYATIGNGFADTARGHYSAILSGSHNIAGDQMTDTASVVIGGLDNTSTGRYGLIGNGTNNSNYGTYGIVGNGYSNTTGSTAHATVLNGAYNYSDGENSLITAGYYDTVTTAGDYSLVVGRHVYLNTGYRIAFFESAYSGRLGINRDDRDGGILYPIHVGTSASNGNGAYLTVGGIWTNASSKYKKEDFCTLDGKDLLNKVAGMDITNWKFKDSEERHISPVAQDFYKAFGCGAGNIDDDSTHIAALDMAGVSLRAVQELTKMVRDQQVEIAELKAEIAKLKN
jgi:hypothetical protein